MSNILTALVAVLLLLLLARIGGRPAGARHEGMVVSPEARQITQQARKVFSDGGGNPQYKDYKREVRDADPVQFTRVRELHRSGGITPERVQAVI